MSGDGFGRDDFPGDQPAPEDHGDHGDSGDSGDSGPTEPAAQDQHFSGGDGPDPDAGATDYDLGGNSKGAAEREYPGVEDGPDFGDPDEPDAAGHHFDPLDADDFHADVDASHIQGTPAPPGHDDRWTAAIGYGAADPGGAQPGLFDHLDPSSADSPHDVEPEWLTEELAGARSTWVDPSLFDAFGARETASLTPASGAAAVAGLWTRLAPGTTMPTDVTDALDALAARAGPTSLRQVVEAARRLLDE